MVAPRSAKKMRPDHKLHSGGQEDRLEGEIAGAPATKFFLMEVATAEEGARAYKLGYYLLFGDVLTKERKGQEISSDP
jgi:hypothetical protein